MLTAASLQVEQAQNLKGKRFQVLLKFACDSIKAIFSGVITGKKLKTAAFNYKQWKERTVCARLQLSSPFIRETKGGVNLFFAVQPASRACSEPGTSAGKGNVNLALGCPGSQ